VLAGHPDLATVLDASVVWQALLPRTALRGDSSNLLTVHGAGPCTHLRFNIFPDGGVARLRVHGRPVPDWARLGQNGREIDLAAAEHGGLVVAASDMFFGPRHNLIMPGPPLGMQDGWETRRRRGPGHDWAIVQLARAGRIGRIEVDTTHFKGNAPGACSLEACTETDAAVERLIGSADVWTMLLPRTALQPDTRHEFVEEIRATEPATHVRLNVFPDGGVGRLRLWSR
jgi:allantoicase